MPEGRRKDPEAAARYAIQAIRKVSDEVHIAVLSLVDDLIEIGLSTQPVVPVGRTCSVESGLQDIEVGGVR